MGDNRPIVYDENDISIYRASAIGSCLTALVASKLGYEANRAEFQENILMNAAKEGNLHEDAIIAELTGEYGWRISGGQDTMEMKIIPRVFIRGHIDGICRPKGARKERVLEVKTMSRDRFKKWVGCADTVREKLLTDDFLKYGWQISAYMHHHGMPAMYVVKNRDSGELFIEEITIPPVSMKEIRKKIIQAEMWGSKGELPTCNAASGEKFFCAFAYLHDDSTFGSEPEDDDYVPFDNTTEVLLAGMAEHYIELVKQVATMKPIDEERKDLGKKLIETMGGVDSKKYIQAGGFSVKRTDSNSTYVDTKGVAKTLGITIEEYDKIIDDNKKKRPYSYVTVKNLGDK